MHGLPNDLKLDHIIGYKSLSNLGKDGKHIRPKNLKLDFTIGMKAEEFLRIPINGKLTKSLYYINFSSDFSLNGHRYDTNINDHHDKLHVLIGKKVVSLEFIHYEKIGDLKLIFDSGDELVIHEDDTPYESYTMQTPDGLFVV